MRRIGSTTGPMRTRLAGLMVLLILVGATACTSRSAPPQPDSTSAAIAGPVTTTMTTSTTSQVTSQATSALTTPAPTGKGMPITVSGTRTVTGNERLYGASVGKIPGAVYQSDVVVIGGGADAIVGAEDNGMVWTVKGSAPGVSRLVAGDIMVATAFATGRVEQVAPVGANVRVTLAPVALTDIFQELNVSSSSPVTLAQPLAYSYGSSPLLSTDGDSGESAMPPSIAPVTPGAAFLINAPPAVPSIPSAPPAISLPAPSITPKEVHEGKFTLTPYCCFPSEGVHIAYNEKAGRMAATVGIVLSSEPLVDFHIDITAGGLKEAVLELHGPKAIEFEFTATTTDVSGNYQSPTLRVPIAFSFPIAGIPFTVTFTQSVRASIQLAGQAAFSSKGEYSIAGGLGFAYRYNHFDYIEPAFSSEISSLQNAASLSVGINALSIGYGAHFSIGIGVIGFNGGLNLDLDAKLAISKDGSPPQTSLTAGCSTAAVSVDGSFGIGYTIPEFVAKAVNLFLSLFEAKPILAKDGKNWGPFHLWSPGSGQRCFKRS